MQQPNNPRNTAQISRPKIQANQIQPPHKPVAFPMSKPTSLPHQLPTPRAGKTTITFPQNPRSLSSDTRASENRSLGRTNPFAQPVRFPLQHSIPPTAAPAEESFQRPRRRTVAMAARIRRRRCVFECVVEPVLGLDAGGQRLGIHLVGAARDAKRRCSMCCIRPGVHREGAGSRVGDKFPWFGCFAGNLACDLCDGIWFSPGISGESDGSGTRAGLDGGGMDLRGALAMLMLTSPTDLVSDNHASIYRVVYCCSLYSALSGASGLLSFV